MTMEEQQVMPEGNDIFSAATANEISAASSEQPTQSAPTAAPAVDTNASQEQAAPQQDGTSDKIAQLQSEIARLSGTIDGQSQLQQQQQQQQSSTVQEDMVDYAKQREDNSTEFKNALASSLPTDQDLSVQGVRNAFQSTIGAIEKGTISQLNQAWDQIQNWGRGELTDQITAKTQDMVVANVSIQNNMNMAMMAASSMMMNAGMGVQLFNPENQTAFNTEFRKQFYAPENITQQAQDGKMVKSYKYHNNGAALGLKIAEEQIKKFQQANPQSQVQKRPATPSTFNGGMAATTPAPTTLTTEQQTNLYANRLGKVGL